MLNEATRLRKRNRAPASAPTKKGSSAEETARRRGRKAKTMVLLGRTHGRLSDDATGSFILYNRLRVLHLDRGTVTGCGVKFGGVSIMGSAKLLGGLGFALLASAVASSAHAAQTYKLSTLGYNFDGNIPTQLDVTFTVDPASVITSNTSNAQSASYLVTSSSVMIDGVDSPDYIFPHLNALSRIKFYVFDNGSEYYEFAGSAAFTYLEPAFLGLGNFSTNGLTFLDGIIISKQDYFSGPSYHFGKFGTFTATATIVRNPGGPAVPEPSAWALLIVGFAGTGAAMRSKRQIRADAFA